MFAVRQAAIQELSEKAAGRYPPRLFILSAPSGTGKDTVIERLRQQGVPFTLVVTYTTRPRRPVEVDGVDYNFVSRERFLEMRARGEFLEHMEYAQNFYGVPKQPVVEALARGENVLLKIDVQGAGVVKLMFPSTVLIFLAPPSLEVLEQRLRQRGITDAADLERRLAAAARELACIPGYDYLVVNHQGRLDEAVAQIESIFRAEGLRVGVPPITL